MDSKTLSVKTQGGKDMKTPQTRGWLIGLFVLILLSLILTACAQAPPPAEQETAPAVEETVPALEETAPAVEEVTPIDITVARSGALAWPQVAIIEDQGYYEDVGLNVESFYFVAGREAMDALVGKQANIATVALTPIVFAAFQAQPVAVVAENASYPNNVITARKDANIAAPEDLRGKKIGTALGTDLHYFLDTFLAAYDMSEDDVEVINVPPNDLVLALSNSEIDAFSIWQPMPWTAEQEMGDNIVFLKPPEGTYEARYLVVTMQDFLEQNPEAVRRFLQAFYMADQFIEANPEEAKRIVAEDWEAPLEMVEGVWDGYRHGLRLEPTLITEAESQAQWAIDVGNAPAGAAMPDYRSLIFPDPLREVAPDVVTLE
jgi:NitT/TauT family transport system substrate-binding protein